MEKVELNNTKRRQNPENRLSQGCWSEKHSLHQQSQQSSRRRPHQNLFISCCSVSCIVTACLPHDISKQDEKQVSGKQATDPTPKQWNAAKAPRQEPDIPAHVLVWRKGMQGRCQVAQIVDFPAERCTCQQFLMF